MRRLVLAVLGLALIIFVFTSGLFECITKVTVWLITLDMNAPTISIVGQLIAKYGTWIITYLLVGIMFNYFGWFNSNVMKIIYAIVSTVISFLLSWLIMAIERYLLIIVIIILVLLVGSIAIAIVAWRKMKKKENKKVEENE